MHKLALTLVALFASGAACAQTPTPPPSCTQAERAQFDFWVGDWDVLVKGQSRGSNKIERVHGGCVVLENYRTNDGRYTGTSINMYLPDSKHWVQRWGDSGGLLLELDGAFENGAMRMQSRPDKGRVDRVTWTRIDDDHVRQFWEKSSDNGASWTTAFDGLYVRKKGA
ncbi:hypothetical protein [Roseiterribacter gracilis]|uniref:DUF1579 domain-containing protein n=1 Tax=Roseiterribacter gracilis TaxID=2812848 RepID=A0A8S8XFE0_9PROT|nr:hypothetical protein TMPK1_20720 [Rhodospirillales bacterium TMPK1]